MGKNLVNRSFLVESFDLYNKAALKDPVTTKVIDTPEAYLAAQASDTGALLIVADSATLQTGEIKLSTVTAVTTGFNVGDYVTHQAEVSHNVVTYKNKYVENSKFSEHVEFYTQAEVEALFDLSPTQVKELEAIINDSKTSTTTLWSSKKTHDEILAGVADANKYTDGLIGKMSGASLEVVTSLPTSGMKSNVIYLYDKGAGDIPVYIYDETNKQWIDTGSNLGSLNFSDYYNKTEIDTALNSYTKKTDALLVDDLDTTPINWTNEW